MKINETLGLPDIDIIDNNYINIVNIINNNKNNILKININDFRLINNKPVGLNFKIDIYFLFTQLNNYSAKASIGDFIKSEFKVAEIYLNIPKNNPNIENIIKSLCHELTHFYEFYQNKNKYDSSIWVQTRKIFSFDKELNIFLEDPIIINELKFLFYYSFSSEINARISSLNKYLMMYKKNNQNINLSNILYNTNEWVLYKILNQFDSNKYFIKLNNSYTEVYIIDIFNLFIEYFNIKRKKIKNLNDVKNLLKKIEVYFKVVAKSYKNKMLKLLSVKIQEKIEKKLYNYGEYIINSELINDISEIKTINYDDIFYEKKDHSEIRLEIINFILDPYYKDYIK